MKTAIPRLRSARARIALLGSVAVAALLLFLLPQLPASALTPSDTPTPVTGNATWFDALGAPYGGCGLPQANLDIPHFIALNVFNTPNDYTMYSRPVSDADAGRRGMWNDGKNCGRFVQVSVGDYCTGLNDGATNSAFCRNGSWVSDQYNGATLVMQVADSCADPNGWCRDDPYHIDLSKPSVNQFVKDGQQVSGLLDKWNNRHVSWQFIPAPNYTGDINIGWMQGAQVWWPAIAVSHLANGIHGVEYLANGVWTAAKMNGDMGQSFIIGGTASGTNSFQIRVKDVNDQYINGGRVYSFAIPSTCGSNCSAALTPTTYTTSGGSTASPVVPTSAAPTSAAPTSAAPTSAAPTTRAPVTSAAPTTRLPMTSRPPVTSAAPSTRAPITTRPPTTAPPTTRAPVTSAAPTTRPPVTSAAPTSAPPVTGKACSATYAIASSWGGAFQGGVTVKNSGTSAITSWKVSWTFANGQTISQVWNGTVTTSGSSVSVSNVNYNGSLGAGATTDFGFLASWNGTNAVPAVTCTAT